MKQAQEDELRSCVDGSCNVFRQYAMIVEGFNCSGWVITAFILSEKTVIR